MSSKFALAATAAALVLTIGGLAEAQQSPSSSPSGTTGAQTESRPSGDSSARQPGALGHGTLHEIKSDDAMVQPLNIKAGDLRSMAIYGSDGNKIGDVNNVLADQSNEIKAVTVDVGGFLGIGSREVVIPIDKLQKGSEENRLQTAMTKDEIERLDAWSDTGRDNTTGRSSAPARSPDGAPIRTPPDTAPSRR